MPSDNILQAPHGSLAATGRKKSQKAALPPLFWYMEMGEWEKATERAQRHPREVKSWATLRTKSMVDAKVSGTKRLALHHACFKLRSVVPNARNDSSDAFIEVCKFILLLIQLYPEASGVRETRHGCLPLHLAAFASCAPRIKEENTTNLTDENITSGKAQEETTPVKSNAATNSNASLARPQPINKRSTSESTAGSIHTNMTAMMAEELYTGTQTADMKPKVNLPSPPTASASPELMIQPNVSVALKSNVLISAKREDMAVQVINALLDAYPKGIRVDSEGGRLPLHTACAGRATPRVISTLLTAYPAAARHRNKDGFLPLHLAAHWGVSHPNVAITLLKAYPDSTLGRNRWERTPLEEALCMAGENGRPHQAALVRALRKHPSYWTRPPEDLFRGESKNGRMPGSNIVDIDESLPDEETSMEEEERRYFNSGHTFLLEDESAEDKGFLHQLSPAMFGTGKKSNDPALELHQVLGLSTLIKNHHWDAVAARIYENSHEAGEALQALTRGGFIATGGLTALHYACERRPPLEVVEALIAAWPEAVTTRLQPGGALPLHVACTWGASTNVVNALTHAEPATCRIPDDLGNIPLHCAAFSGAMAPIVDILLRMYPKSVLARNHQGSLPSDIVKRLRHDNRKSVIALLTCAKEEVLADHHRRNKSSGSCDSVAQRAMELNNQIGAPSPTRIPSSQQMLTDGEEGHDVDLDVGVEVTYEVAEPADTRESNEKDDDLLWI